MTPLNGRFLLDTNIVIPAVVLGELFFGAAKSGRPSENAARVERVAIGRAVVSCDVDVAREYGRVKQRLQEKGRLTRDRHFKEVDDLPTADWAVQP